MRVAVFLLVIVLGVLSMLFDSAVDPPARPPTHPPTDPATDFGKRMPVWPHTEGDDWRYPPRNGIVRNNTTGVRALDERLRRVLLQFEPASSGYTIRNRSGDLPRFVAEPAVDGTLHAPQAFLLGQVPYRVEQAWMPLYAISERMRYQLDTQQFQGREEVWLTTLQAWSHARGDCEDHAIPLADWLIEMGWDARVVLGTHRREGHAWVIVFNEGREYLLEATDKTKVKNWSAYPLAKLLPDYHPELMFNRKLLWVNTGSSLTVNYTGQQWRPTLRFDHDCKTAGAATPDASCGR